ncbi:MBOAT family protein [Tritrichomonas foetus]|uniref:MBOAT family protein n=1 Tax=Tritrichomonas foetus TaxID=1144522 RepID=A0A1J4K8X9_9EUKA|nr:MBOAT family protein [Tritrichomonas foetus]|eukprot:OHT07953.1 MBOAT family protein [Tritrichomonas foetus]
MKLADVFQQGLFAATILCDLPFSIIIRKFSSPSIRLYLHILFGFTICWFLYHEYFLYVFAGCLLSYLLLYLPGALCLSSVGVPFLGLISIHYYKLKHAGTWSSDISGLIMFSFLRIWSLAFNVYDGKKINQKKDIKRKQWRDAAITKVPSIVEYVAYLFSYNGLYSGPILPFKDFIATCNLMSSSETVSQDIRSALPPFITSILVCGIYGIGVQLLPANLILSDGFKAKNYLTRLITALVLSAVHTSRYIFAWVAAESGWRALGASHINEEYITSIILKTYYSSRKLSILAIEWNRSIHFILKEYLHVRLISIGVPNFIAKICTFAMSAIWHGFYSGYYLFAAMETVMGVLDEFRLKWFSPLIESLFGPTFCFIFDVVWIQSLNYFTGAPWDLYWAECYWEFYKNMKFLPFFLLLGMISIGFLFGRKKKSAPKEKKD